MEEDTHLNILSASKFFFPWLTSRETPFEEALNWLQFAYTADRAGAYVAPASTVLNPSAVAEGGNLFQAILSNLSRLYP